jgi:hypothetical protein
MRLKQPALATRHRPSTRIVIIQIVALRLVARRSAQRSLNLESEWRGVPRAGRRVADGVRSSNNWGG